MIIKLFFTSYARLINWRFMYLMQTGYNIFCFERWVSSGKVQTSNLNYAEMVDASRNFYMGLLKLFPLLYIICTYAFLPRFKKKPDASLCRRHRISINTTYSSSTATRVYMSSFHWIADYCYVYNAKYNTFYERKKLSELINQRVCPRAHVGHTPNPLKWIFSQREHNYFGKSPSCPIQMYPLFLLPYYAWIYSASMLVIIRRNLCNKYERTVYSIWRIHTRCKTVKNIIQNKEISSKPVGFEYQQLEQGNRLRMSAYITQEI